MNLVFISSVSVSEVSLGLKGKIKVNHWGLRVTKDAYFSLLTCVIRLQVLKLVFGRTEQDGRTDGRTEGQTNVEVEIVI